jgi:hypothetical protein
MMKNYFYSNEIAEQIRTLIDSKVSSECAKNISVGDMGILPGPDKLAEYLPAVLINAEELENIFANESLNVSYTPYYYSIYYLYPYTFEGDNNAEIEAKKYAQEVANVLMNYRTLDNFKIGQSDTEIGGLVVYSQLSGIKFDSAENELFRALEVPAKIAKIEFVVGFRTYADRL